MQARKQARNAVPGQRAEPHEDQVDAENEYAEDEEYDEREYDEDNEYDEEYDDGSDAGETDRAKRTSPITAAGAAHAALEQLAQLVPKEPEGVTGVEPADGSWIVGVEVVEDRRIPSSADILATYEARVDEHGTLVSYQRTKRYTRGHSDLGGGW